MYKSDQKELKFENFYLPFGGKLSTDNLWVKLGKLIPWTDFGELYPKSFCRQRHGSASQVGPGSLGSAYYQGALGYLG